MDVSRYISRRLRLSPSEGGRRSPAVAIAIAGVALAIVVMMATVAIVTGFQNSIRQKVMGFEAPIVLAPLGNYIGGETKTLTLSPPIEEAIKAAAPGAEVVGRLQQGAILKSQEGFAGVELLSIAQGGNDASAFEQEILSEGHLPETKNEIAISSLTAKALEVGVGEKLDLLFFIDGGVRMRRLEVSGLYASNFDDYDRLRAYTTYDFIAGVRHLAPEHNDRLELRNIPLEDVDATAQRLQAALMSSHARGTLDQGVMVNTVFESGAMYFNWLSLLDANVVVILVIMALVSGFMLVSCLLILILQRLRMIGVLKSLGSTNRQIARIFLYLGMRVVGIGMVIGNVVGIALLLIQRQWHPVALDPKSYYLSYVPVEIHWQPIVWLNLGVVALALVLMLLPTAVVSRISPSSTMRYE